MSWADLKYLLFMIVFTLEKNQKLRISRPSTSLPVSQMAPSTIYLVTAFSVSFVRMYLQYVMVPFFLVHTHITSPFSFSLVYFPVSIIFISLFKLFVFWVSHIGEAIPCKKRTFRTTLECGKESSVLEACLSILRGTHGNVSFTALIFLKYKK